MPYTEKDYLMHYGRKGMKWYQHIYQNKDGSLTKAGYRKLDRDMVGLFDEKYGSRKTKNRKKVSESFARKFSKTARKYTGTDDITHLPQEALDATDKLFYKYIPQYTTATIKDLKLYDTPKVRAYLNEIFRQDADHMVYFAPPRHPAGTKKKHPYPPRDPVGKK